MRALIPVNVQPSGQSAMWISVSGLVEGSAVELFVQQYSAKNVHISNGFITAEIPSEVIRAAGDYEVRAIIDGENVIIGEFKVLAN